MKIFKKLLIIVPVICGIVFFAVLKMNKKPPVRLDNIERKANVRVIELQKISVIPRVTSYGYVESNRTWSAIPEVSGKVVYMHEDLKKGHFIKKGEILLKIDTASYSLSESRGKADLANVDAKLKELAQQEKNTRRLLSIEKKSLKSAGLELNRKKELFRNGYISASDLEKEERSFFAHQTGVKNLQNSLDLIPSQKKALLAQKKSGESTVSQQQLDVQKTQIKAPFNCRLSAVNIELDQFAAAGSVLAHAISIDKAEIPVPLTPEKFFKILPKDQNGRMGETPDMESLRKAVGISARVKLPMDAHRTFEWEGKFSRTSESMDTKTGAFMAYITVDKPYENAIPGKRPPLVANMYVEVVLSGKPLPGRYVIPRSSVHDSRVYLVDKENRLEIRPVDIEFVMGDIVVLKKGFKAGEKLVLTDLVPAIAGMLLNPVEDPDAETALMKQALGEAE